MVPVASNLRSFLGPLGKTAREPAAGCANPTEGPLKWPVVHASNIQVRPALVSERGSEYETNVVLAHTYASQNVQVVLAHILCLLQRQHNDARRTRPGR